MSDLISRTALLKYFEEEKERIKVDSEKYHIHEEAVAGMEAALQAITNKVNEMPTAYDIEKVVARIRRSSGNGYRDIDGDLVLPMIETKDAIDIVRKGGVE